MPVREQTKVVGHAVRAMYMYTAMADLAAELDDAALKHACEVLWDDVIEQADVRHRRASAPRPHNEGFTTDYDLPNETAYAETCATVAMIFWAQRMLQPRPRRQVRRRPRARPLQRRAVGPVARRRALFL